MRDAKRIVDPPRDREVSLSSLSRGQLRSVVGVLAGAGVFVTGLVLDPILSLPFSPQRVEGKIDASLGYSALILTVAGLTILFAGATALLTSGSHNETNEDRSSVLLTLSRVFSKGLYSRILLVSASLYGVFYALASGIIVYDPGVSFSAVYHVSIPSSAVATCCSPLGQTPLAVVYLTDHVGLLFVPVNLLLLFSVSWLVGLNVALGVFLFSRRVKRGRIGWLGGIGALAGLFTSCPTCAGLSIFSILGGTSTLSAGLFLGPLQALFVSVSVPFLVASPIVLARSLRGSVGACPV